MSIGDTHVFHPPSYITFRIGYFITLIKIPLNSCTLLQMKMDRFIKNLNR